VEGHWAVSFLEKAPTDDDKDAKSYTKLPFIVDPTVVFGANTGLSEPSAFFDGFKGAVELAMGSQVGLHTQWMMMMI
jgi:hypothetical protein